MPNADDKGRDGDEGEIVSGWGCKLKQAGQERALCKCDTRAKTSGEEKSAMQGPYLPISISATCRDSYTQLQTVP